MVSVNVLKNRRSSFKVGEWLMDSGAFTNVTTGRGHMPVEEYAAEIRRWASCGQLLAAVAQDYMCEPFVLGITGMTVADHQRMTIERYDALMAEDTGGVYVMPVLQGYQPAEYVTHIQQYGDRLKPGMWVGVGSVCKRNSKVSQVEAVLEAIHRARPDLRLHGFGLKLTALRSHVVNEYLHSCDSMAWSFAARKQGRNANDPAEAVRYAEGVIHAPIQMVAWPLIGHGSDLMKGEQATLFGEPRP